MNKQQSQEETRMSKHTATPQRRYEDLLTDRSENNSLEDQDGNRSAEDNRSENEHSDDNRSKDNRQQEKTLRYDRHRNYDPDAHADEEGIPAEQLMRIIEEGYRRLQQKEVAKEEQRTAIIDAKVAEIIAEQQTANPAAIVDVAAIKKECWKRWFATRGLLGSEDLMLPEPPLTAKDMVLRGIKLPPGMAPPSPITEDDVDQEESRLTMKRHALEHAEDNVKAAQAAFCARQRFLAQVQHEREQQEQQRAQQEQQEQEQKQRAQQEQQEQEQQNQRAEQEKQRAVAVATPARAPTNSAFPHRGKKRTIELVGLVANSH